MAMPLTVSSSERRASAEALPCTLSSACLGTSRHLKLRQPQRRRPSRSLPTVRQHQADPRLPVEEVHLANQLPRGRTTGPALRSPGATMTGFEVAAGPGSSFSRCLPRSSAPSPRCFRRTAGRPPATTRLAVGLRPRLADIRRPQSAHRRPFPRVQLFRLDHYLKRGDHQHRHAARSRPSLTHVERRTSSGPLRSKSARAAAALRRLRHHPRHPKPPAAGLYVAGDGPSSMAGEAIMKSKVELLSKVATLNLEDASPSSSANSADTTTSPATSRTRPSRPALVHCLRRPVRDNDRWRVPFSSRRARAWMSACAANPVQAQKTNAMMGTDTRMSSAARAPDEAIYMVTVAKERASPPSRCATAVMDLTATQFKVRTSATRTSACSSTLHAATSALRVGAGLVSVAYLHAAAAPVDGASHTGHPSVWHVPRRIYRVGQVEWSRAARTWQEYVVSNGAKIEQMRGLEQLDTTATAPSA